MKTASELGKAVREYRQVMGFSQAQFGELAGISRNLVSLIERGKGNPKMKTLARIEAVLEVMVQELRNDEGKLAAWYVRDAWVDPALFVQVLNLYLRDEFHVFYQVSDVRHRYMRLMPNKQPYLLKDTLERGWWIATILEISIVAGRLANQETRFLVDWVSLVSVS